MLDAVGIPRQALVDPDLRIASEAARDLLELSARAADDFALRMSDRRTPSVMGPLALIAREQPTVRAVMEAINRYHALHTDHSRVPLEDVDDEVTIMHFVQSWSSPGPERQSVELGMAQMVRTLRQYLGGGWRPLSASFVHAAPKVLDSHRRIFGPNLDFDQSFHGLVCRRADLDRPNPVADPEMARQIERYIDILGSDEEAGFADRVRAVVVRQLAGGGCAAEPVAHQFGIDLRTLQRQLAAANTSFLEIVQETRMGLIPLLLEESDCPLAEVSERLGFSALSTFSRWHRAHYNLSPSAHRLAARARTGGDQPTSRAH